MVPFESMVTVSYSPSKVIMAVSLAISEIFNVKERSDLEIWVCGRSRSLKMARFDRPRMTFYGFAIVTIGLSCTVFSQPSIYIDGWLYGMRMTSVVCNVPVLSQNDSTYHHSVFTT